jgi:hypothetical protein
MVKMSKKKSVIPPVDLSFDFAVDVAEFPVRTPFPLAGRVEDPLVPPSDWLKVYL